MKIVCDNCATKYSIADEKVSGKVFKIRCKKCSHVIVVKGTGEGEAAQAPAPEPAAVSPEQPSPAAGAVWHLVIDREQVGPMTAEDVRARFTGNQIDADTYIWREGYGDWIKLSQSEEFRDLMAAAPAEQATTRVSPDLFKGTPADEGPAPSENLFGGGVAQVAPGVMTTNAQAQTLVADGGAAAFGLGGMSSVGGVGSTRSSRVPQPVAPAPEEDAGYDAGASNASAGGVDVRPMTGARSENSVLFSLNNLQALAAGGGAAGPAGPGPSAAPSGPKPGYASTASEGSGLIDIRAMAAQTLAANNFSAGSSANRPDELPMVGNDAPLFAPVAPAVLLPTAQPAGVPKWVWGLVAVGGLGVVALVVVLVVTLSGQQQPQPQPQPPTTAGNQPPSGPVVSANQPAGTQPTAKPEAPAPTKPTPSEVKNEPPPSEAGTDRKSRRDRGDKPGRAERGDKPARGERVEAPPAQPTRVETPPPAQPTKPAKPKAKDDLDALLEGASAGSGGKPRAEAKKDAPEQLSMDMIKSGLKSVSGTAQSCGTPGTYMVKLTIGNSGRVSDASVPGKAGDAGADCVSKAVKGARFPEFTGSPQTITYPIIVR